MGPSATVFVLRSSNSVAVVVAVAATAAAADVAAVVANADTAAMFQAIVAPVVLGLDRCHVLRHDAFFALSSTTRTTLLVSYLALATVKPAARTEIPPAFRSKSAWKLSMRVT